MNKKQLTYIFAFILLALIPIAFILLSKKEISKLKSNPSPKPMWPLGLAENGKDSIYFQIPIFQAQNADGTLISTQSMEDKISIVETFFSSCQSICPIMNKQMQRVYGELSKNTNFRIFSYSVDYERDDLATLKTYAEAHNADLSQWYFLRSPQDSIFNFGRWGLKIPVGEEEESNNFLHSERFILVDWNRNIRGYYDGTDSASVNKLMNHVVLLLSEKDRVDKKKKNND